MEHVSGGFLLILQRTGRARSLEPIVQEAQRWNYREEGEAQRRSLDTVMEDLNLFQIL